MHILILLGQPTWGDRTLILWSTLRQQDQFLAKLITTFIMAILHLKILLPKMDLDHLHNLLSTFVDELADVAIEIFILLAIDL